MQPTLVFPLVITVPEEFIHQDLKVMKNQNQQRSDEPEVEYKDVHSAAAEQYEINKDASDIGKNFGDQGHTSYKKSYVGNQMKDGIEEADVESWDPNKM